MTSSTLALTGRHHPTEPGGPWLQTFALFDRILILQRGRVVYFGPNGSSALEYFQGSPHFQVSYRCRRVLPAASCCQLARRALLMWGDSGHAHIAGAGQAAWGERKPSRVDRR